MITMYVHSQAYYWSYDWSTGECQQRTSSAGLQSTVWTVWSWLTEIMVFLVVPLVTLVFNIFVIREVRRISTGTPLPGSSTSALHGRSPCSDVSNHQLTSIPESGSINSGHLPTTLQPPLTSSRYQNRCEMRLNRRVDNENIPWKAMTRSLALPVGGVNNGGPSSAATTVMLLSVSFYVIATTLPATLVYVLESEFPEGDLAMSDPEILTDPTWSRYLAYILSRKIV